jgi:3-phosphoshikimate 1-carboxyvinyltransferase
VILQRHPNSWHIRGCARVRGRLQPPADKSLMHRALILASLAHGRSQIVGRPGEDVLRTAQALRQLGIDIKQAGDHFDVYGRGLYGLHGSRQDIDCGNSGTTMRLLAGLLAAQPFRSTLIGPSICRWITALW